MGLDWCVRDKPIPDKKENLLFADAHLKRLGGENDAAWRTFLDGREPPMMFPNALTEEFSNTEIAKELKEKISEWEFVRSACVVSPLETLGAPEVGSSEEADEYVKKYYVEIKAMTEREDRKKFLEKYPTAEDYLESCVGKRVSELATNKAGLGSVTGIAVGPESFRGKCVSYIDWLSEDLKNEAYENHDPEELISYGERLIAAALEFEKEVVNKVPKGSSVSDSEDSVEDELALIKQAGSWCIFWGEAGHSMHAWY